MHVGRKEVGGRGLQFGLPSFVCVCVFADPPRHVGETCGFLTCAPGDIEPSPTSTMLSSASFLFPCPGKG